MNIRPLLAGAALLLAALTAAMLHPTGAQATTGGCVTRTADYSYAAPRPDLEALTATTLSCRRSAPWVVTIHGGSWIHGTRYNARREAAMFYAHGWQAFNIDYRRGPGVSWRLQQRDLLAAWRWITARAARFGIDPARGSLYGFSAGGHLAAWLGTQVPAAAVVTVSGVLEPDLVASTTPAPLPMANLAARETRMMGCPFTDQDTGCVDAWRAFEPAGYLTAAAAPLFAVQGDADQVVPTSTPDGYCQAAQAAGVGCTVVHVPGYGHTNTTLLDDPRLEHTVRVWMLSAGAR